MKETISFHFVLLLQCEEGCGYILWINQWLIKKKFLKSDYSRLKPQNNQQKQTESQPDKQNINKKTN